MSSDLKIGVLLNFFFFGFLFFFHFFGLHWMILRNGMLKIMGGGGFEKKRKKRRKRKKILKKKARTGFEPAIFGFRYSRVRIPRSYETDALPLGHRATTRVNGWN